MSQAVTRGFIVAAMMTCAWSSDVWAQPKPPAATTDPARADEDFSVQGEYWGQVLTDENCYEWRGLQIVALGDGRFQGFAYRGGLPGYGWDQQIKWPMIGARAGARVQLTGPHQAITLNQGIAEVRDLAGRTLGQLPKVERHSPTLGDPPPAWSTVLFDGTTGENLIGARLTADRLLQVGAETRQPYRDFLMHVEFRTPYMPAARGQARGNSGVYIQGRYEVQVLDSFGLEGLNNECGSLYKTRAPDLNMCLPPLTWQTYDIDFQSPRFDADGKRSSSARLTVRHNGVVIHNDIEISNKTGGGAQEGPDARPIKFQNHGNPVHYRNIWIVEYQAAGCPTTAPVDGLQSSDCSSPADLRHRGGGLRLFRRARRPW